MLELVAVAVHFEDVDMVSDAIQECSGKPFRAKGLGPLGAKGRLDVTRTDHARNAG